MTSAALWLALGIVLLYVGGELLIKGAAGLGRVLGLRPLIVGLTVVAYGTSMPELIVSLVAAVEGRGEIALGNVIGSNIANLGLILGVTALARPLKIEGRMFVRELPFLLVTTAVLPLLLADGTVSRGEALLALAGAVAFTRWEARRSPAEQAVPELVEADAETLGAPRVRGKLRLVAVAGAGLLLLVIGGELMVTGAAELALLLGLSQRVVGLTIVAVGTSAPELAACLVAALRNHGSIAVGNVVGSNIFNVLFVLGGAGLVRPIGAPGEAWGLDVLVLGLVTLIAALLLYTHRQLTRLEGLFLALLYAGYLALLLAVR